MLSDQSLQADSDDRLLFADETPDEKSADESGGKSGESTWKIMLVDDEPQVHQATKIALKFFTFEGRSLHFISAYSALEANQLMEQHPDTVLMLLDVIMETQEAGLQVAQYVRDTLDNKVVRIVLRTGQPGQVPEQSVVVNYDINDYKTKLELTQEKLFTTLVSSIRAYRYLVALAESERSLSQANLQLETFNKNLEERIRDRTRLLAHEVEERSKAEAALKLYIHALTHDLRNPVTGMSTVLQSLLAREQQGKPPSVLIPASVLTRMQAGCDRQLEMIGTLLETHSIEIWGMTLHRQPLAIAPFIADIVEDWQPRLAKKRATLRIEIEPNLPVVEGDRTQLWRVFENLIDNAIKYNPPGVALLLTIRYQATSDDVPDNIRCTLQDNGVGIAARHSEQLFELYQRGDQRSSTRGLGLGLYVCRRIVETHGGTIGVNAQLNQGSAFWFTLPITSPVISPVASEPAT